MNLRMTRQVIDAARGGYSGVLPSDTCACGGVIEVTHTTRERGGWVLRRLACGACKKKYGKWAAADSCEIGTSANT